MVPGFESWVFWKNQSQYDADFPQVSGPGMAGTGFTLRRNRRPKNSQSLSNNDWDFTAQRGWANKATNMWITIKNPRIFGRAPGICGGAGEQQLHKGRGRNRQRYPRAN